VIGRGLPLMRPKDKAAAELGRRGGLKGGLRRWWAGLTPEQRRDHQRKAALRRWENRKDKETA